MIVKVTVTGIFTVLVSVPLILPVPLAAMPVTVATLSLVQLYTVPTTLPVNTIGVIATPEHTVWDDGVATAFGVGFTTTVAVIGAPLQPLAVGVIVKVTVTAALVVFVKVPDIFPEPLAAIPVTATVLSLVQLYTVPATLPLSTIVVIGVPEQEVCADGVAVAFGVGLTKTVAVIGVPKQVTPALVYDGVMVNVTVNGAFVILVNDPLIGVPEPLAAIPVTVATLSLVQLNTVPGTVPVNAMLVIADPEQIVCEDGVAVAFGVGLTVIVKVFGVPVQASPPNVFPAFTISFAKSPDQLPEASPTYAVIPTTLPFTASSGNPSLHAATWVDPGVNVTVVR